MGEEHLQNPDSTPEQPTDGTADPGSVETPPTLTDYVSKNAYRGLQTKLNQRNEAFQKLSTDFDSAQTALEQANRVSQERLTVIGELRSSQQQLTEEVAATKAQLLKYEALRSLLASEETPLPPAAGVRLMGLLDKIPAGKDLGETVGVLKEFAQLGADLAREAQRGVGQTPGYGEGNPQAATPATRAEWLKKLEGADPEDKLWDQYRQFEFDNKGT